MKNLLSWLKGNLDASLLFMRILRYETSEGEWNPIVIQLLEHFQNEQRSFPSHRLLCTVSRGWVQQFQLFESRIELLKKLAGHANPSIEIFSRPEIEYFERLISEEKIGDKNYHRKEIDNKTAISK